MQIQTFSDTAGRTWTISINVGTIKRVRELADVNLLDILADSCKLLVQLHDDPVFLCTVLYAICQPQMQAKKVSDEDFGQGMAGDVLLQAADSLTKALIAFFPDEKKRALLTSMLAKISQAGELIGDKLQSQLEAFDPIAAVERLTTPAPPLNSVEELRQRFDKAANSPPPPVVDGEVY